jgi:uncharacterized membrane protein YesL
MAGFFGFFDYTKPGPGIPKNLPPKPRPVIFFEVLQRKFWKIIQINLLYILFNIPALILLFFGSQFMFPQLLTSDIETAVSLQLIAGGFFMCFPVLCFGPAQAGMTYVLRNYSREEHAFVWGDFKEHALKNAKESLAICVIDFAVFCLLCVAMNFYWQMLGEYSWAVITLGVIIIAFIMFAMMHLYIYPMLVTFKIGVKQIYKNAMIFSVIRFLPNLGFLLIIAALYVAAMLFPFIGILLCLLILFGLFGLIINSYSYPVLKKYMIDRVAGSGSASGDSGGGGDARDNEGNDNGMKDSNNY